MQVTENATTERCLHICEHGTSKLQERYDVPDDPIGFVEVRDREWRALFDDALDLVHYSGSCQRVGRCMRLAIIQNQQWVGGIVLGSTFPNILVRDEALGLRKYVTDYKQRGLVNPWSRENHLYWRALQRVVNHARTFVFPQFQGSGIGIHAHAELLKSGVALWEQKYGEQVDGLDTLCTADESKLFLANSWQRVGQTRGYSANTNSILSKAVGVKEAPTQGIKNNIGLQKGDTRWWVWVIEVNNTLEHHD